VYLKDEMFEQLDLLPPSDEVKESNLIGLSKLGDF
jgi:hypothetical protein